MPGYHLLGSLHALPSVVLAGNRRFGLCKLSIGNNVGDHAFEALHVHIWISATIWDPKPGAGATFVWTGREIFWNLVGGQAFPRCTISLLVNKLVGTKREPRLTWRAL